MFRIKKKGFTLTELIIVMTLTLIILGMIFQMFNTNNRIMSDVDIKSTLQNEGEAIQETLSKVGMQANSMDYKEENNDVKSINFVVLNEDESKSEFEIKKQNIELYIVEYKETIIEGKKEKKKISTKKLSNNLNKINIKSKNDKSAQIEIILSKKMGYSDVKYPVNVKFAFRNK
ncbi:prepilin-type N-terminal cleavage/methylation domain-containing protein [Clostridium botulinum]|uniref:PilW family protein n=1 Tax=Clostridium botulinum TaxID=1491 RepID=UPI0013C554D7|nr:prepilin-type N-terminal cleavage/methylation domain-containing protein [Clostridium botulinum]MBN1043432.1 prepilin-type N-terminal cleavage/methylation domain-containing protein [Clostridium botulinum]NFN19138.1 prepilin-type N-terminal cleavage/methylation domain-containing protein [Clostridium botulinum]NFN49678.1 prepilin-type N-terminal cleavage/methylation domain-containing protein [Clostridium botulinum]